MTKETSGYSRPSASYNARRTEVGRGKPMGELLRRYWMPIAPSDWATDLPRAVRALGEDLILYRDKLGQVGLLHSRCCHRGASLLYARVEEDGIRCCYHGWKFDAEGNVLERPAEPKPGPVNSIRQPWYPLQERYGLIFAYMGPLGKMPLLPRFNFLEHLDEGDQLWVDAHNIGAGGSFDEPVPNNFFQRLENSLDPAHFFWLHFLHSGPQFGPRFGEVDLEAMRRNLPNLDSEIRYEIHNHGTISTREEKMPDGRCLKTVVELIMPTFRVTPNPFGKAGRSNEIAFMLPVDDTSYRIFTVLRGPDAKYFDFVGAMQSQQRTQEECQRFPNDYEAIVGQGKITLHSEEHLGVSDRGIVMLRRMVDAQLLAVEEGRDPIGLCYDPGSEYVQLQAGSFITAPDAVPT